MNFWKNKLTLFFSLPFYPVYNNIRNFFYHGHIALGIEEKVYQIFNPYLLKSDFLVSIMPIEEWLYNDSNYLVDRDKDSKTYTYVHLYRVCELRRTTVFCCILNCDKHLIENAKSFFSNIEKEFKESKLKFRVFQDNCSGLISDFFNKEKLVKKGLFDFIPFLFFKKVIFTFKKKNLDFYTTAFLKKPDKNFEITKICIGVPAIGNIERYVLRFLQQYNFNSKSF